MNWFRSLLSGESVASDTGIQKPGAAADFSEQRDRMVREQIERQGILDGRVLDAMRRVPRHRFMPAEQMRYAYEDHPNPIGFQQTISQPYIVAFMTEAACLRPESRVLEIGTGCGYQTAVLAEIAGEVYSVEIVPELAQAATRRLAELAYGNVHVAERDGYSGWPEFAPFDAIVCTAAPRRAPQPLLAQLHDGGRLVIPLGESLQELTVFKRKGDEFEQKNVMPVRFVPMTGTALAEP